MKRTPWLALAALVPFVGILVLHAGHYFPFLSDDSLISLRYARRLLDGQGLTWTDGHRVEGYSNLLWLLTVAAVGRIGVDLVTAARGLGVLGMTAAMFSLTFWYVRQQIFRVAWFPITVGLLFLSLGAPIAVWAIGGLEQPLFAALLAAAIPLAYGVLDRTAPDYRRTLWLSLALGLLCLTRPDGPIFAAAAAVSLLLTGWLAKRPRPVAHALVAMVFPLVFSSGQLAFRAAYYGELVPNTALVKIAPSPEHWRFGSNYLSSGFHAAAPLSQLAVVAMLVMLVTTRSRSKGICLAAMTLGWSLYVAFIGGDIFPAYRHLVPLMVIFAFALAEGAFLLASALASRLAFFLPVAAAILAMFVPYSQSQFADTWSQKAMKERWEWQGKEVGLLLKRAFSTSQPLVAVTAAGCVPYWSELPSLDMMGLNDYYIPRHRPANFGSGMVGHELGDGAYVFAQHPDIIVFDVGSPQPSWVSGGELNQMPEFHERYVPVAIKTQPVEYSATIFIDKESPRIGVARSPSRLTIPGYFFTGDGAVAQLNAANKLVAEIASGQSLRLTIDAGDTEPGQSWSIDRAASRLDGVESDVHQNGRTLVITLHSTRGARVEINEVVLAPVKLKPLRTTSSQSFTRRRGRAEFADLLRLTMESM